MRAPDPDVPLPLFGLAILFAAMFASVFMPGQRIFLHIVAGIAILAKGGKSGSWLPFQGVCPQAHMWRFP
jgi:hypothetical protein